MLRYLLLIFAISFSFVFASPQHGGTLIYARSGVTDTFDPALSTSGETFYATRQVYDTLVQNKYGSSEIEPALASSWEVSEDGLEYTFHLRKNVYFTQTSYFNKVSEFSADDVIFSIKRQFDKRNPYHSIANYQIYLQILNKQKHPKTAFQYWSGLGMGNIIKDIVKIDKYTVKFILKQPNAIFLTLMTIDFGAILSKDYADSLLSKGKGEQLTTKPVGTGPFILQSWDDSDIVFIKNQNFWGLQPYVDKLIMKSVPDSKDRIKLLKTGKIDMMDLPKAEDLELLKNDNNIKFVQREGVNIGYLAMNELVGVFKNKKVRQAINHAIDKNKIVRQTYGNLGKVTNSPVPASLWAYNPNIKNYEYNPQKAKQLLKEAGYENGFKTTLWAIPVQRAYMPNGDQIAKMMQSDLAKVGIEAKIVTFEWKEYLKKIKNGEHDMALLGWNADTGDPDDFLYALLSKKSAQMPASNRAFWLNDEYDALVTKARQTSDIQERKNLYFKAQEIFAEEAPWVTLANSMVVIPTKKSVHGFKLDPTGKRRFLGVWKER